MRSIRYIILFQLVVLCLGLVSPTSAQLVLNQPNTTGTYTDPVSIRLTPGFSTTSFHAFIQEAPVPLGTNASGNQNYILTTTYLSAFTSAPSNPMVTDATQQVQYFDGLGRPLQTVQVKATPSKTKDVVIPISYDAYGREDKQHLPYATATGAGGAFKATATTMQASYYNSPPAGVVQIPVVSGVTHSFSQTQFESSPLNRIEKQGFPGRTWQPAATRSAATGHTVDTEYGTNNTTAFGTLATTRRVALYRVTLNAQGVPSLTLTSGQAYAAGELNVTVTKDENWTNAGTNTFNSRLNTTEEYTDKQGHVVLKRTFNLNGSTQEMLSTYYVYDDFGNLTYVLPPGINPDRSAVPTNTELNNFAYQYRYDERNRLIEKQLPGKGREFMVYNQLDQLVATQDAVQRGKVPQEWTITKYDGLGRVVLTGIYQYGSTANTNNRATVQTQVNSQTSPNLWEERSGTTYTNRAWPASPAVVTVLTEQFYDDYNIAGLLALPAAYRPAGYSQMTHNLPTASRTQVLGSTHYLWSVLYYDNKGRVIRQFNQHYKGGSASHGTGNYDDITHTYTFTGQVNTSIRKHYTGTTTASLKMTVYTRHEYDHQSRLTNTWKRINTADSVLIAKNDFNELGQLRKKSLHSTNQGTTFADSVKYAYNPRGWVRESVSAKFKQYLKYDDAITGVTAQYNGNISRQQWQHGTSAMQTYDYSYDKLNRLTQGTMAGSQYKEALRYDRMGNITHLGRTANSATPVDTLTYTHIGNRLMSVADATTTVHTTGQPYHAPGTTSYTYDANGNVRKRQNAGSGSGANNIDTMIYNYLNLPQVITATAGTTTYTYDAVGRKLRTMFGTTVTVDYIDGIEWEGNTLNLIHMEEGRILPSGVYEYVLKDHLGNTRSGFASNATSTAKFVTDYYPYGLSHLAGTTTSPKNRYLYNGKELQDGTGYYDYGMRLYDPIIGRFEAVDPVAEMFLSHSPFGYSFNNPVNFEDFDGMAPEQAGNTDPIKLYGKQIDMTNAPGTAMNAAGYPRNGAWFWRQMLNKYPEMFSGRNSQSIEMGRAPVVDDQWVKHNPTHAEYKGGKLVHHHIDQGKMATGIPETAHRKYFSNLHQNRGGRVRGLGKMGNALGIFGLAFDIFSSLSGDPHSLGMQFAAGQDLNTLYFDSDTEQYFEITSRSDIKDDKGNVVGKKAVYNTYSGYRYNKFNGKYEGVGKKGTYNVVRYENEEDIERVYHQLMNGI